MSRGPRQGPVVIQSETAEFLKGNDRDRRRPIGRHSAMGLHFRGPSHAGLLGRWPVEFEWLGFRHQRIVALSPLAGSGQAADLTEGNTYYAHLRFPVGSETVVLRLGVVVVE